MIVTRVAVLELAERKTAPDWVKRFPATLSTETPVPRVDARGRAFNEVLSHADGAVILSRAPLPLIESHDRSRVNVGVVDGLRLDGGRLRGDLILGTSARGQELARDIEAGIVRSLSVGYSIDEIDEDEDDDGERTMTATRWTPQEISLVSVPADINAGIGRSSPPTQHPKGIIMPNEVASEVKPSTNAAQVERERVEGSATSAALSAAPEPSSSPRS
jgi:HK97 family phage prohead protease